MLPDNISYGCLKDVFVHYECLKDVFSMFEKHKKFVSPSAYCCMDSMASFLFTSNLCFSACVFGPVVSIVSSSLTGHHPCHKNILCFKSMNTRPSKN